MSVGDELGLLCFIAICFAAALGGALFRPGDWYAGLKKPSWRPSNRLFAPVWMVLFGMIAASGWLVWREVGLFGAPLAFVVYGVQLILNFAWSWIAFGLRRLGWAAVEMAALWVAIVANIAVFAPLHAGAAWLLVPYLAWVSFAFVLNVAIWRLNRGGAGAVREGGGVRTKEA